MTLRRSWPGPLCGTLRRSVVFRDRRYSFVAPRSTVARFGTLCAVCPVHRECLDAALADDSLVGLWGGTDEKERKAVRREGVA